MGEKPLVIMPHKYVRSQFRLAYGAFQTLRPEDMDVIKRYVHAFKALYLPSLHPFPHCYVAQSR